MKIRTITCHDVNNYGASLQALALQTYLTNLGHDVKIIDYVPDYMSTYDIWKVPKSSHLYKFSKYTFLATSIYALKQYIKIRPTLKRIDAFKKFNAKYLRLTRRYNSYDELAKNPPEADLYIAGSDQIWSTHLKNGKDGAFYCAFGKANIRRISYAASFGFSSIIGGYDVFVKCLLNGFDKISTRENTGKEIVEKLGLRATQVVDPVFLLDRNDWLRQLSISHPIIDGKYILVYDLFRTDERLKNFSRLISTKYNYKVVAVNDKIPSAYADININDAGPVEFVNLIAHAEMVIADSFHATAFSVIFRREFYTFYQKENISRMSDLLSNINLLERLNATSELPKINWRFHESLIESQVNLGKDFLNNI